MRECRHADWINGTLAQRLAHLAHNQLAPGSNPGRPIGNAYSGKSTIHKIATVCFCSHKGIDGMGNPEDCPTWRIGRVGVHIQYSAEWSSGR